jgi:hypothetical protein
MTQNSGIDAPLVPEIERERICMTPNHRLETLTWRLKWDKTKQKLTGEKDFLQAALQHKGFMAFCEDATCTERIRVRGEGCVLRAAGCGTSQPLITLILRFYIFQMYFIPKLQSSFPSCSATIISNQGTSFVPQGNKHHGFERNELCQKCRKSLWNKEASNVSGNSSPPYAQPQVCNYSVDLAKCG